VIKQNREYISLATSEVTEELLLISRVKDNDVSAFEQLYRLHSGRVFALCLRLSANNALAEEFAQEAFVRAWQKIHSFRGESSFSSWLYRLTSNVVLSELRKKRHKLVSIDEITEVQNPIDHKLDTGKVMDMEKAISHLPTGARAIFVLHDVEGYKHKEIAEMTGLAVGTSKTQLHRARKLLKGWL
jgi:RNA polymerase sigma-70 factor (ECF subfamily)